MPFKKEEEDNPMSESGHLAVSLIAAKPPITNDMTYEKALEWIEANKKLIGTKTEKGILIGDLVAVPVDTTHRDAFMSSYVLNHNKEASLIPYVNEDLEVWAIDTYHLETNSVLFYKKVAE